MSHPRRIVPGSTYFLTRRTLQRYFMLGPRRNVSAIIAYCLAEASITCRIELVAWIVMSNHYHAVAYDRFGTIPAFLERFHRHVALVLNTFYGRKENFWSSEETCVTRLVTYDDILDKVAYTITNPVAAGLVARSDEWPGLSSIHQLDGESTSRARPTIYFRQKPHSRRPNSAGAPRKLMPASVELRAIVPIDPFGERRDSRAKWAERVRLAVAEREREIRAQRGNKPVLGRKKLLATKPTDRPATKPEDLLPSMKPHIACLDKELRQEAIAELQAFRVQYANALRAFFTKKNKRSADVPLRGSTTEFPVGTYRFRAWGARCAPHPRAWERIRLARAPHQSRPFTFKPASKRIEASN